MKINLLLFAALREKAGQSELALEFDGHTVGEALQALAAQRPELRQSIENGRVQTAVNEEYAESNTALSENDTLALIPPVSGGEEGLECGRLVRTSRANNLHSRGL